MQQHNEKSQVSIKSIIGPSFYSGLVKGSSGLLMISILMLLGRQDGPELVGIFSLVISIIQWLSIFACFGLQVYILRHVSGKYEDDQVNGNKLSEEIIYSSIIIIALGAVLSLLTCAASGALSTNLFGGKVTSSELSMICLVLVPAALLVFNTEALRGSGSPVLSQFVQVMMVPLLLFTYLAYAVFIDKQAISFRLLLTAYIVSTLAALLVSYFSIARKYDFGIEAVKACGFSGLIANGRKLISIGSVFLVYGFSLILLSTTDMIMLGILSTTREVGIYAPASKMAAAVLLIAVSVNNVTAPRMGRAFSRNDMKEFAGSVSASVTLAFLPTLLVAGILFVWSSEVLSLFGKGFTAGSAAMNILVMSSLLQVMIGPVAWVLNMANQERRLQNALVYAVVLNVVLNAILIPGYGATGAAIATTVSVLLAYLYCAYIAHRLLGVYTIFGLQYLVNKLARR